MSIMDEQSFRKVVEAIEEYNRYRSPEAAAKILSLDDRSFRVEFTGSFCLTCGFYDYLDDYRILLEEMGLKINVAEIEETDYGAIVEFEVTE